MSGADLHNLFAGQTPSSSEHRQQLLRGSIARSWLSAALVIGLNASRMAYCGRLPSDCYDRYRNYNFRGKF